MVYYDVPGPFRPGLEQKIVAVVHEQLDGRFKPGYDPKRTGGSRPLPPQQSLSAIRTKKDFVVELMVAEPLVSSPVAIDWGPWDKAGMVTPETRRQFLERGIALVSPDAGRRFLLDEIRFGATSESIVAAMGRLGAEEPAGDAAEFPVAAGGTLIAVGETLN